VATVCAREGVIGGHADTERPGNGGGHFVVSPRAANSTWLSAEPNMRTPMQSHSNAPESASAAGWRPWSLGKWLARERVIAG